MEPGSVLPVPGFLLSMPLNSLSSSSLCMIFTASITAKGKNGKQVNKEKKRNLKNLLDPAQDHPPRAL